MLSGLFSYISKIPNFKMIHVQMYAKVALESNFLYFIRFKIKKVLEK